jgi:hypothetical protein
VWKSSVKLGEIDQENLKMMEVGLTLVYGEME